MKTLLLKTLLFISISFCLINSSTAQIENDDIYIEFSVIEWYADLYENYLNLASSNIPEPVINAQVIVTDGSDVIEHTICQEIPNPQIGESTYTLSQNFSNNQLGPISKLSNIDFTIVAWERDEPSDNDDNCVYEEEYDDAWTAGYVNGLTNNNQLTNQRAPGVWHNSFISGPEYLFVSSYQSAADIFALYGFKPGLYWSYAHGDTFDDPLNFGTLSNNDQVSHENTTNPAASGTVGSNAAYTNTGGGYDSPDVYYSFSLAEEALVNLTTLGSDFDTYMRLFDDSGNIIENADDIDGPAGELASSITRKLCEGDYVVLIEGAQSFTGLTSLEISTFQLNPFIVNPFPTDASCPTAADGELNVITISGVAPYEYEWDGESIDLDDTEIITDIVPGTYSLIVTDFCGTVRESSVDIDFSDVVSPICMSNDITVVIPEGMTVPAEDLANEFLMAFDDNCGVEFLTIDAGQDSFSADDLGNQNIEMTATDASGNSTTCNVNLNVTLNSSSENELGNLKLFPVPTDKTLYIEAEKLDLENVNIQIFDMSGRKVYETFIKSRMEGIINVDVSGLNKGMHILRLFDETKSAHQKFTKL